MGRFTAHTAVRKSDEAPALVVKDAETNLVAPFTSWDENDNLADVIGWMEDGDLNWVWRPAGDFTINQEVTL